METLKNARIEILEVLSETETKAIQKRLRNGRKFLDERIGAYKAKGPLLRSGMISSIKLAVADIVGVETAEISVRKVADCAGVTLYIAKATGSRYTFEIAINRR